MLSCQFNRGMAHLKDFTVVPFNKSDDDDQPLTKKKRNRAQIMALYGDEYQATDRFWNSLLSRFHLSDTVFNYFKPAEVFERIVDVNGDDSLRFTVEHPNKEAPGNSMPKLLGLVGDKTIVAEAEEVDVLFSHNKAQELKYADGMLMAYFDPSTPSARDKMIGKDAFRNRFIIEVPVDGWGKPRTSLAILRLRCMNGMVAMTPSFRSVINLGNDPINTLDRVISSFNDSEGYNKLHERLEVAQKSWASVKELQKFRMMVYRHLPEGSEKLQDKVAAQLIEKFGDLGRLYGIVNPDNLPVKTQAVLPTKATVYDLLNISSELATHHIKDASASVKFQAFNGSLLSEDYDLQNTVDSVTDFQDFFVKAPEAQA